MNSNSGSNNSQVAAAIRGSLNATLVTCGSKATSAGAVYLGSTTAYTGGLVITNADAAITIWVSTTGVATVAGAACYPLLAGASLPLAVGNLAAVSVIPASGTPTIGWVGTTL